MKRKILYSFFIILILILCINTKSFANIDTDIKVKMESEPSTTTEVKTGDIITYKVTLSNNTDIVYGYPLLLFKIPVGTEYVTVESDDFMREPYTYEEFVVFIGSGLYEKTSRTFELKVKVLGTIEEIQYPKLEYIILNSVFTLYDVYKKVNTPAYVYADSLEEKQAIIGETAYVNDLFLEHTHKVKKEILNESENTENEELENEYIGSEKYRISNGMIRNIEEKNTVENFLKNITNKTTEEIKVEEDGKVVGKTEKVKTGMVLKVGTKSSFNLVVQGDISQDGNVSVLDLSSIKEYIIKRLELSGARYYAGDINGDNKISIVDISKLKMKLVGLDK